MMAEITPLEARYRARGFWCNGRPYLAPVERTLAICLDGTARDYLELALANGAMPNLGWVLDRGGHLLSARAQLPTLTNVNNASIVTGVSAAVHGISGNHYLAPDGRERQLIDPEALRGETILAAAQRAGIQVLAVSAKEKLRGLLGAGGVPSISAERADEQTLDGLDGLSGEELLGRPRPGIYDPELSSYAIDLTLALAERLDTRLAYCSLTDYVQHKVAPGDPLADSFYGGIDMRLGRLLDEGWRVGMVADHGMSAKTRADGSPEVRYLSDALTAGGCGDARVVLPITDPYVVHHGALGSMAFVYVESEAMSTAHAILAALPGVQAVLDRAAAAIAFELPEDRIGDLVVCADAATALGKSAADHDLSALGGTLRSHGGMHEQEVPLVICHPVPARIIPAHGLRNADLFSLLLNDWSVSIPAAERSVSVPGTDRPVSVLETGQPAFVLETGRPAVGAEGAFAFSSTPSMFGSSSSVSSRGVTQSDCPFCADCLRESSAMILDEDEHTVTLMHPEPATNGHALVVPRRHVADLYEIAPEDLTATVGAAQRLAVRQRDRLGAEGVNLLNACRPLAWQTIFHFHLHVVPRYALDGLQPPWAPHPGDRHKIEALAMILRG